jgi:geranylgeranyl diphosphate synthase type I
VELDRLQVVLADELGRRRADVVAVDPRLATLADLLVDFVAAGGKRLRPEFLWCGWRAAGGAVDSAPVLTVGVALELIQACALIHDDVIDRSERRRGRPATHRAVAKQHADAGRRGDSEHFGVSAAVLLGDLALAWADDLYTTGAAELGAVGRSLPVWQAMRTEVLSGQLLDLVATAAVTTDPASQAADAMRVNRFKTAAYTVERPMQLGAELAGASAETVAALRCYGADVGVAFQLRDDLLGVYGDPAVTGKPAGDDLREGKRTLLLAIALERADRRGDTAARMAVEAAVGNPRLTGEEVQRTRDILIELGAVQAVEQRIAALTGSALDALAAAPVADPAAMELAELAVTATRRRR